MSNAPQLLVYGRHCAVESIVLDIGATIGADARQLVDYAVMGAGMARALFEVRKPTVGLLNVGTEEVKGLDEIRSRPDPSRYAAGRA